MKMEGKLKIFSLCVPDEIMDLSNGGGWRLKHEQKSWWMGRAAYMNLLVCHTQRPDPRRELPGVHSAT